MKKFLPLVALLVIGVGLGAILFNNDNKPETNTNTTQSTGSNTSNDGSNATDINSPAATNEISIVAFKFTPANIVIKQGTAVTWTNNDSVPHTVSKDSSGGPDSKTLNAGDTFSFTFNETGTFGYHCDIHQDMHGTVTVTE